jgi:DNA helicase-2/ATP-dependent DNA helicase PcrA
MPFQRRSHNPLAEEPSVQAIVRTMGEEASHGEGMVAVVDRLERAVEGGDFDSPPNEATLAALRRVAARHGDDLAQFLSELALGADADLWDSRADRASLLTLHAAKGLEVPVVFIVGCEDGLLPLCWGPIDEEALAEERRLMFVGMTRARQRLILTHARKRRVQGRIRESTPSPFLDDIQQQLLAYHQHRAHRKAAVPDRQQTLFE